MSPEEFKKIVYVKDENHPVVWVFINTPDKKNAMSFLSFHELCVATDLFEDDDDLKAMIITGTQDPDNDNPRKQAFSSGGYFDPSEGGTLGSSEAKKDAPQIDPTDIAQKKLTLRMWQCEKPVIAAINGLAVGAGLTMPLAVADLIVASEYAWAQLPFVKLGILPEFSSTYLLPRLLGVQKAKEIIYLGERLTAENLRELGLINKVVPHDQLNDAALGLALKLIPPKGAGLAVKMTKKALHGPLIDSLKEHLDLENEGLNIAVKTADFMEGIVARQEKRAPQYKGT